MNTEEKYMNSITNKIVAIKMEVWERNWKERCLECQQSGLSMKDWCRQNGINPIAYYTRLRKLREKVRCDMGYFWGYELRFFAFLFPLSPNFSKLGMK